MGTAPKAHGATSHYGALATTQLNGFRGTQNSASPLLPRRFIEGSSSERTTTMRKMRRGVAAVVVTALAVILAAACYVWKVDSSGAMATDALAEGVNLRVQSSSNDGTRPSQVFIALYDATAKSNSTQVGITVSWATAAPTARSTVRFGQSASELTASVEAVAPCQQYKFCAYESPWFHHVVIDGSLLEPDTTYFYQCGDSEGGWSEVLTFTSAIVVGSQQPVTFAVIGDLGQTQYSQQTVRHLINQPNITAILHAGDLSYADSYQPRWDSWAKLVEPLSSTCPWMISAGNHEEERPCQQDVDSFVAYQKRFRMPYDSSDAVQTQNLYYGFRAGMVHVIILTPYVASDASSPQHKWLKQELSRVNRALTPWVIVMMHGPWYNSNTAHQGHEPHVAMKANMEDLFFQYRVDLAISGHVHAYERSFAVYKEKVRPDGTVYVVLGDGGNREGLAPSFIHPKPEWSAFRQANYGFGLFRAVNRTHAQIEMYEDQETGDARLQDSSWLTTTEFRVATSTLSVA